MATLTCPNCHHEITVDSVFCNNCGTPLDDGLYGVTVNGEKGTYKLEEKFGRGGHSDLYRASWTERRVSICAKVFKRGFHEYAQREQEILSAIKHPNIVRIFDVASVQGQDCLILEYLPGGTLYDQLKNGKRFSASQALSIINQLASALRYLHEMNVVHCDVKPGNILLDGVRVVLSDFSIARYIHLPLHLSAEIKPTGTLFYMSPEQASGASVGANSDQYSLALVSLELLMGRRPFETSQYPALRKGISRLITFDTGFPPPVMEIILRALADEPSQRYPTVEDFAQELSNAVYNSEWENLVLAISPLDWKEAEEPAASSRKVSSGSEGQPIRLGDEEIFFTKEFDTQVAHDFRDEEAERARALLSDKIERYFDIVSEIFQDQNRTQDECFKRLQDSKLRLVQANGHELKSTLPQIQFELRLVHALIAREQRSQQGEKWWRWTVPLLVLLYTLGIISIIVARGQVWRSSTEIPIVGVPVAVFLWAGIGSLAAILYRFYTRTPGRISEEIKWLVARPIIGVIMGALAYLAVISGIFILTGATGTQIGASSARPELLWILAFLGGFSDRFFEGIIQGILGQLKKS